MSESLTNSEEIKIPNTPNEQIYNLLVMEDEVTWQTILKDLVKTEQMDPWDVDLGLLAGKFMETLQNLEKSDFRISGKVVLAAAVLLKMKSDKFIHADMDNFDRLVTFVDAMDEFDEPLDDLEQELLAGELKSNEKLELFPRTPQPRKRKVSIFDLVDALEKALEVKQRRVPRRDSYAKVEAPKKSIDLHEIIDKVQETIMSLIEGRKLILFDELIPSETREDKVLTFIPCLHLDNQRKIELKQEHHFGEIEIHMLKGFADKISENINVGDNASKIKDNDFKKKKTKKTKKKN